jgi:hypothetical protein
VHRCGECTVFGQPAVHTQAFARIISARPREKFANSQVAFSAETCGFFEASRPSDAVGSRRRPSAWHDLCSTTLATRNEAIAARTRLGRALWWDEVMTIVRQDGSVEFRFLRPEARDVRVAGDFNGWSGESLQMKPAGNGWWTARVILGSGEYRFRYVADGRWFTDYASNGVEFAKLGLNSLLIVPKRARATTGDDRTGVSTKDNPDASRRSQRDNVKSAVM